MLCFYFFAMLILIEQIVVTVWHMPVMFDYRILPYLHPIEMKLTLGLIQSWVNVELCLSVRDSLAVDKAGSVLEISAEKRY